jgi:hypothetical protein
MAATAAVFLAWSALQLIPPRKRIAHTSLAVAASLWLLAVALRLV